MQPTSKPNHKEQKLCNNCNSEYGNLSKNSSGGNGGGYGNDGNNKNNGGGNGGEGNGFGSNNGNGSGFGNINNNHNNRPNRVKWFENWKDCWTHGCDVEGNHTDYSCPNPAMGHIDIAHFTMQNPMGSLAK